MENIYYMIYLLTVEEVSIQLGVAKFFQEKNFKAGDKGRIESTNILPNILKDSFQRLIEISASYGAYCQ